MREAVIQPVIANQSSDWCGDPIWFLPVAVRVGFPRQCAHWLGMTYREVTADA